LRDVALINDAEFDRSSLKINIYAEGKSAQTLDQSFFEEHNGVGATSDSATTPF
jgi:hypothetical protein